LSTQQDLSAADVTRRLQQPDNGLPCQGFAGTGFTDNSQNFPFFNDKRNTIQSAQNPAARRKLNAQIPYFKKRCRVILLFSPFHHPSCYRNLGFKASDSQSPIKLTERTRMASSAP